MRSTTLCSLNRAGPLAACSTVFLLGLVASQAGAVRASHEQQTAIRVLVNGEPVRFENTGPREINGRLMVPLRGVLEKTGAYVGWVSATQTVSATRGDLDLELIIGSRNAKVNGRSVRMDVPAMTIAGNTMVPLRFVSESLGSTVDWDSQTRTVSIETSDRAASEPVERDTGAAHRTPKPRVDSITHNLTDNMLAPGQVFRITMRGTPGGQAWFRIRGIVGEVKMRETESGIYVGSWRNTGARDVHVDDRDILAFIVVRNNSSPETMPGGNDRP